MVWLVLLPERERGREKRKKKRGKEGASRQGIKVIQLRSRAIFHLLFGVLAPQQGGFVGKSWGSNCDTE